VPGCKVDTMLVLIGKQGIKKSMSLEILAGGFYLATHAQVTDKDFIMSLHRGWIIDLAELSSMTHSDANHIKGIITNATDHIRPPYGMVSQEMPRHSVMVGTTNVDRFLRDGTGNRRFWPVECGVIDTDWIVANRPQLLAEARTKYAAGQIWWDMPASTEAEQERRMEVGPWDATLERLLSNVSNFRIVTVGGVMFRFITSDELLDVIGIEVRYRKSHMYRDLAAAMRRVGGTKWRLDLCNQRITFPNGDFVERARGYFTPVTGNPIGNVVPLF